MTVNNRLAAATEEAEKTLRKMGIHTLPVDPFAVAKRLDIAVRPKPIGKLGVSGMLLRKDGEYGIIYSTHVTSRGFQRFSVAHEIGHYLLPGHMDHISSNGPIHKPHAGFGLKDNYELEADHFAAGLLMPDPMFSQEMRKHPDGMNAIKSLAQKCEVSLVAAAIRYIGKTDAPAAIIVSQGGNIEYCFMSKALKEFKGLDWLTKNTSLPNSVRTYSFNLDSENISGCKEESVTTDLVSWFGGERELEALEEIVGLGAYGKTLTAVSLQVFADEEDEDKDIEQSWCVNF